MRACACCVHQCECVHGYVSRSHLHVRANTLLPGDNVVVYGGVVVARGHA